jgi:hypothetical protein
LDDEDVGLERTRDSRISDEKSTNLLAKTTKTRAGCAGVALAFSLHYGGASQRPANSFFIWRIT